MAATRLMLALAAPALMLLAPLALAGDAGTSDGETGDHVADDQRLTAADPARIARYLRQLGYRTQMSTDQTGDPWIRLGFAGMEGSVWFNDCNDEGADCDSIRLQVGLLTAGRLTLAQVNDFNGRFRFATLSLDEDGDPLLNHDLRLQRPGVPAALFGWTVQQFESVAAELRELVNETEPAAAPPDSAAQRD